MKYAIDSTSKNQPVLIH